MQYRYKIHCLFTGHEVPSPEQSASDNLPMSEDPELYNLEGQILHKVEFVKQFVPESRNIYFIGHSVGAKIVLELLKHKEIETRTKKCYLLFPTLEHIAKTPNGKILIPTVTYGLSVILFFAWVCNQVLLEYFVIPYLPIYKACVQA